MARVPTGMSSLKESENNPFSPSCRLERQGGVVQIDAQLALGVAEVAEGVLHLGLLAIGIRKEIIPLRERCGTLQEHAIILEADARPGFECKALVLGKGCVARDEVGQCCRGIEAKGLLRS